MLLHIKVLGQPKLSGASIGEGVWIVYSVILEMGIPERGHARGGHRDMGGVVFPRRGARRDGGSKRESAIGKSAAADDRCRCSVVVSVSVLEQYQ